MVEGAMALWLVDAQFWVQWWISRQQSLILSLVSLEIGLAGRQGPSERVASPDSRMDTGAGAGAHRQGITASASECLGRWASVFNAEVCDIAVCSRMVMKEVRANTNIAICSDSQFAIKAVNGFEDNLPVGLGVPGADEAASHIDGSSLCECSDMLKLEEMRSLMN